MNLDVDDVLMFHITLILPFNAIPYHSTYEFLCRCKNKF